jgi:hypothetical protein
MFTWPEIVLLLLKLANAIMGAVNDQKSFQAGTDAEIAKTSASILKKTAAGKKIMEKIDAMSAADVDSALIGLEPK